MLGFGGKHEHKVDPTTLPVLVHAVQSAEASELAQRVWQNNQRYVLFDGPSQKELLRFVFSQPPCVVWLERDKGRLDMFELILMWDADGDKQDITEVYVISSNQQQVGDDTRVKSLLNAISTTPSTVPANNQQPGPSKQNN